MASDEKPTTEERLATIEALLRELVGQKQAKDFYSTREVAERAGRSEYQVREWCRTGRLEALKRNSGRGRSKEWMISHDELMRYESHGLRSASKLPV
jgi:transposase